MVRSKDEIIRRLRLGNLRTLFRHRYGTELPDDDAGREDLNELLLPISLGPKPTKMMANEIDVFAPWVGSADVETIIDFINRLPISDRKPKAEALGKRLRLTNAEREWLRVWTILPCDISREDLAEQRKAKARARSKLYRQKQREKTGKPNRADYLAHSLTKTKPWKVEGISRATWYRQQSRREAKLAA
jgi:hypothetical protein